MQVYIHPDPREWDNLLSRPRIDAAVIGQRVADILDAVRAEGDQALLRLTAELDGVQLSTPVVTEDEIAAATAAVPDKLKEAIRIAAGNIEKFHAAQIHPPVELETMPGVRCVQRQVPIRSVGLYVPGGSAPLFSTVLMLGIPARLAGCSEIVLCTPPGRDGQISPVILYAAGLCGITRVFKAGGAQAIGAMAYGTQSIPRVDKLFGPGNQYVTVAKQQVSKDVAIDMPAGPSEVLVMADETAVPEFAAADLLSQAEHGVDSQVILLASTWPVAERIMQEADARQKLLPRAEIARRALENSRIIVMDSREEMISFANRYGAEHLIISMEDAWTTAGQITAAGSIFIGNYTPESAGDYASGTNHTLPTYGWARSMSGVNTGSFMHSITYQEITPDGLRQIGPVIETMAAAEGLDAHKNAVTVRLDRLPSPQSAEKSGEAKVMTNVKALMRKNIRELSPYSTARDEYQGEPDIYLDANENPYNSGYNRYPDPYQKALKQRISEIKGMPVNQIFVGNGSDEPIDLVFRVFCDPGVHNAVSIAPTYGMYKVAAAINNVEMREVQLGFDFSLDPATLLAAANKHTRLLFLCSPNNPTGNNFPEEAIEKILREFRGIVVLDEAYIDFSEKPGFLARLDEFPNLIVLQTLSKAWGMAGLRLGLAFARPEVIDTLTRVKYPYNINGITQQTVLRQLEQTVDGQVREIVAERRRIMEALETLPVVRRIYPSDANFVLIRVDAPREIYDCLIGQGIIVRDRSRVKGCEGCLRITVGTPAENNRLIETLTQLSRP